MPTHARHRLRQAQTRNGSKSTDSLEAISKTEATCARTALAVNILLSSHPATPSFSQRQHIPQATTSK